MADFAFALRRLMVLALAVAVTASAQGVHAQECLTGSTPVDEMTAEWRKTCTHPLCGFVLDTSKPLFEGLPSCRHESWRALLTRMHEAQSTGGVALLGEVHDNGEHHKLRSVMLEAFEAAVFEQIRADQQPGLDQFAEFNRTAARLGTWSDLLKFIDWRSSPWAKTADYRPLFSAVVSSRLPVYPGDPPRDAMRRSAKEGIDAALSADDRKRLALDIPLGSAADAASLAEIDGSHCGMIPKSAQPNMASAQRYRDAHMADVLLDAATRHGSAVLFAGNGHVRTDRGVPWYVRARAPSKAIVSVMLIEVLDGKTDANAYIPRDPDGKPAADFIVFTPPGPDRDKDPCAGMKAAMEKPAPAKP